MGLIGKSIVGLELDSCEIRAVELSGSIKKPSVSAWGRVRLPQGMVRDGKIVDPANLPKYFEMLWKSSNFKSREVILGVNNQDVIVRFASFPKVPQDKIRSLIKFQAQDYIPVPLDDVELDYVVVGEKKTEEGEFINVVLVAARKKMLGDYLQGLLDAKLRVKEIDSSMLAIGRASLVGIEDSTFAVAGYNNDIANILIFKNGILGMARSFSFPQSSNECSDDGEPDHNMIADILFGEIRSSLGYYRMQNNENINKIYLIGIGSNSRDAADKLSQSTGLSVVLAQPYKALETGMVKNNSTFKANDYIVSVSLAMRGLGD